MSDQTHTKPARLTLWLLALCLCVFVVNAQPLNAQTLSFPATRENQQLVIQASLNTPLNLRSVCFSADGKSLYVGAYKQVLIWSLADAKLAGTITDNALAGMVTAMAITSDGKTLAISGAQSGSYKAPVILIDTKSNNHIATLAQTGDTVMCLAITQDGKHLAVGTYDGNLTVWDMSQFKIVKEFSQQPYPISDVTFDDKDTELAVCNRGGQVEVFDMVAEGLPSKYTDKMDDAAMAVLYENGQITNLAVAVGGEKEQSIRLTNIKNARKSRKIGGTPQMPLAICQAPQSKFAYLAGSDNTIVSWSRMGKTEKTFTGHNDWVTHLAISPDEKLLASVSLDGTTKIWNASDGLLLATLVQLSPQSKDWLIITGMGMFNASKPELVTFFEQPKDTFDALRKQWLAPQQVSEHLGFKAK